MKETISQVSPFDAQAKTYKVLAHPARIAILEILREGEHCVCHVAALLGLRQAYISQQLAVLRENRIIRDRRDGWNIFYQVVDGRIFGVLDIVHDITGVKVPKTNQAGFHCECPQCMAEHPSPDRESNIFFRGDSF